jgi:hypothetical protein
MSDVQYSEDGNWQWDNDAQEWKPREAGDSSAGGSSSSSPGPSASPEQSASADPSASPEQSGAGVNPAVTADNASDYFTQAMDAAAAEATEV